MRFYGDSYEGRARAALEAVLAGLAGKTELLAQLDAMSPDDLHALYLHAEELSKAARREWLNRTRQPASP